LFFQIQALIFLHSLSIYYADILSIAVGASPMDTTSTSEHEWTIEFHIEQTDDIIRLPVEKEVLIGRIDPNQTVYNGFDLTPFGGGELGVSRRHALISWEGNQLSVTDLNSDNGTILNGIRLPPEVPFKLETGDLLYIGHMKMKLRLNTDVGQSTLRAKRIDFDLRQASQGRGQRILIVEDDIEIAKMYDVALKKVGFTTHICRDVVSAIRTLNQLTPALIVLDLKLPGVHGLELCRYVRRDTEYPALPVLIVSALSDQESIQQAMKTEADAFLSKPVNIREFVRTISAIVFKNEADHPTMGTKKLAGTASLDHIDAAPRDDTMVLFIEGQREPFAVVVQPQVTMGRSSGNASNKSHVDLDPFGAFDKGVSRVHSRIKRIDNAFMVEDLGSSNGTFVNGQSLRVKESVRLKNGDELRLGELRMHVYLLAETSAMRSENVQGNVA
jgi:CheY-like chemotaxis protein